MEKNPNKPRLWREDGSAVAFMKTSGDESMPVFDPAVRMNLSCMNTSEAAGFMVDDPVIRDELLSSLKGRKKPK